MARRKSFNETHTTITCVDCGALREVRNQDKHQTIRCKECQHKYRMTQRDTLRKATVVK